MNDKIYEMNDIYKQAVADLPEAAKIRDELIAAVKIATPAKQREGRKLLVWMNEKLEAAETALAEEYETYQTMRRAEAAAVETAGDAKPTKQRKI